jgi:hypothetical protein
MIFSALVQTRGWEAMMVKQQRGDHRASDQELQKWIYRQHGFIPHIAWITACKEHRAITNHACPPEHRNAIDDALRHFGLR